MRKWKKAVAFTLALLLFVSVAVPALAVEKPEDMDEATWARLQDNKLEYDEIEDMVRCYNPTYLQIKGQFNLNTEPMEDAIRDLKQEVREYRESAKQLKEEDDLIGYVVFTEAAKVIDKDVLTPIEKGLKAAKGAEKTTTEPVTRQLTAAIQQLMNGYNQTQASIELINTAVELAEAAYASTVSQRSLGMATDTAVQDAQKALLSARNQQQTLNNTLNSLRQNLCILIGMPYDALPEIGGIPAPDMNEILVMNPEQDLVRAVGYNSTIKSQRKLPGNGDANYRYKSLTLEETEAKLKTKLLSLHDEVLKNKTACDAAWTAYESANLVMEGNQIKYQLGMLGRLEYLQTKVAYLQAKMTYDMAVLTLKQSIENYNWAVQGVVELD